MGHLTNRAWDGGPALHIIFDGSALDAHHLHLGEGKTPVGGGKGQVVLDDVHVIVGNCG